jgi:hypothetical protein
MWYAAAVVALMGLAVLANFMGGEITSTLREMHGRQ